MSSIGRHEVDPAAEQPLSLRSAWRPTLQVSRSPGRRHCDQLRLRAEGWGRGRADGCSDAVAARPRPGADTLCQDVRWSGQGGQAPRTGPPPARTPCMRCSSPRADADRSRVAASHAALARMGTRTRVVSLRPALAGLTEALCALCAPDDRRGRSPSSIARHRHPQLPTPPNTSPVPSRPATAIPPPSSEDHVHAQPSQSHHRRCPRLRNRRRDAHRPALPAAEQRAGVGRSGSGRDHPLHHEFGLGETVQRPEQMIERGVNKSLGDCHAMGSVGARPLAPTTPILPWPASQSAHGFRHRTA